MFDINGYQEARKLNEVFDWVEQDPNARIIAGGTDVLVKARERKAGFISVNLIGVTRIPELTAIRLDEQGTLIIGAANTFTEIENHPLIKKYLPLLSMAVGTVGSPQTRNVGTIGGNVCNGAPSADSAPSLFVYNAVLELQSAAGSREVPITEFYLGPGKVAIEPGELLVNLKIRKENYEHYHGHYTKFAQRNALDIANLSCATLIKVENEVIQDLRICFGVAAPTPVRMRTAENYAKNKRLTAETLDKIGELCLSDTKTRDSWRASKEYRDHLVKIFPKRNILASLEEETC